MDIRQIRYFIAAAEELNFSRAALKLHISQPPLSYQIKMMEEELETILFIRTKREVKLTDAGKNLLRECRVILAQLESAIDSTKRIAKGESGELRVGMATSAVFHVMPKILERLKTYVPNAQIFVTDMSSRDQIQAVQQDKIDIGIIHEQSNIGTLCSYPIFSEPFCLAIPVDHPFSSYEHVTLDGLEEQQFIAFSREYSPALFDSFIAACKEVGFSPRIAHTARHPLTIFQMVKLGLGLAIVPNSFSRSETQGVSYHILEKVTQGVRISAVWNPKSPSEFVKKVIDQIFNQPIT